MFFLILLIIIFIYIYYKINLINEHFSNINYISITESYNILTSIDNYLLNFNKYDMIARKINSIDEYNIKIKNSLQDFTPEEINIINNNISHADKICSQLNKLWINNQKLLNIPWNIIKIIGNQYEYGLPHTRSIYIIIPKNIINNNLYTTLIHEKLHIYQRLYPKDIEIYLKENNFTKHSLIKNNIKSRSNPDLNEWLYIDKDNKIYKSEYISENPINILQVKFEPINTPYYEHPYEKMVYELIDEIK